MNCPEEARQILQTMATTREHFNRLEQELVASLVCEKVATVMREISTKAHYVIAIASDLRPSKRPALVYARRTLHPQTGAVVGVLCPCFNFTRLSSAAQPSSRWTSSMSAKRGRRPR